MGTTALTKKSPPGERRQQRERIWVYKNCKLKTETEMNSIIPYQLGVAEVLWSAPDRRLHPLMTSWAVKTENSDCFSVLYFFMRHEFFWQEKASSPHYCCQVIFLTLWVENITWQQPHGSRDKREPQFVQLSTKHVQESCSRWIQSFAAVFRS